MKHTKVKHYVSIAGIFALVLFGLGYTYINGELSPEILALIITGIAGLGGYNLKQRDDTK